jgi:UDP-N-acetylmuramate dehydrogenase
VVLDVTFSLERDPMSVPVRYAELARKLSAEVGDRAPLADVRAAVLALRRGKGMVLDPADPDAVSAGSFFTNPVLGPAELARLEEVVSARSPSLRVPTFPAGTDAREPGSVKVPAAWLIEHAGFGKGYPGRGAARISSKHTLALTNTGGATAAELIGLARDIAAGVRSTLGIELAHEPVLVGLTL